MQKNDVGRRGLDWLAMAVINVWAGVMIATPVVSWLVPSIGLQVMIQIGVPVQALVVTALIARQRSWGTVVIRLLPILPLSWLVELLGSRTGFPFGDYNYTPILQPQLMGVPLLVPLAWLMMLPPAWVVADWILKRREPNGLVYWSSRLLRAGVSALAFTAWDLFLDPQMTSWGFWRWERPGLYFGIPLTNYLGWLAVSFLFSLAFLPEDLPREPLLVIYILTWFLQAFGQVFFWGLAGPAVFGFLGMGAMLAWGYFRSRQYGR